MKTIPKMRFAAVIIISCMLLSTFAGCVTLGSRNPTATVVFSNGKEVKVRLYYDKAPNTVKNFISLANSGFYDGTYITRVVEYQLVQMGAKSPDGSGDAGYYIEGEFSANGFKKNDLKHADGTISMARLGYEDDKSFYNTASSQFYFSLGPATDLDGKYAVFGKVISGLENIEEISKLDVDPDYSPRDEIKISSIKVSTYGKDLGAPKTIKLP